jgi:cysteine peptidase C
MRTIFFLLAIVAATMAMSYDDVLITDDIVNSINTQAAWKASSDQGTFFRGATRRQVMGLVGVRRNGFRAPKKTYPVQALPASFDAAQKWSQCPTINTIRDQSACGSCWAFGAAEAISDRYCTYGGPTNLSISANDLVACCGSCGSGCDGGDPDSAWASWVSKGLVDSDCDPYPFPTCEHHIPQNHYPVCPANEYPSPTCKKVCNNSASWSGSLHYGLKSWSLSGETSYMTELYNNGPFEVAFDVYADFPTYKSGVYTHVSGGFLGGHAVKLTGWGTLNGVPYWKIANSWNADWGMGGFFLIKRGSDECGIEDSGSAGQPKL